MKKLILLELAFLFLATTFSSSPPPPGWYQQTLPVNDQINDIFFLDSLNGWAVTFGRINPPDTAYILKTTNGGDNWNVQFSNVNDFLAIQFADENTGYACGGFGIGTLFKTTNGGTNWNNITFGSTNRFADMSFINKDTGWVCSDDSFDGGVFKTIDGGISWVQEFNHGTDNPNSVFFIDKETGWTGSGFGSLYKTYDGGANWSFLNNVNSIKNILFVNKDTGWIADGDASRIKYTTNGGNNWIYQPVPPEEGIILFSRPIHVTSVNGIYAWAVGGNVFFGMGRVRGIIYKTTNSGANWFYQLPDTSINIATYKNIQFINDSAGWASYTGIIHTTDGGGPLVNINKINSDLPKSFLLFQNYPNPFNPNTVIKYQLTANSFVRIKIFDITGKEIKTLVNQRQNSGEYKVEFNGSDLNSGVYFYQLEANGSKTNKTFFETKKMLLVK